MRKKNRLVVLFIGIVIGLLLVLYLLFITGTISLKGVENNNDLIEKEKNDDGEVDISDERTILYTYTSGNKNAVNGDPETLIVYAMDDSEFEFKYHAVWNKNDTYGIASKIDGDTYIYEKNNYKIEFKFNELQENSVEVKEYYDDKLNGQVNLFK